MTERDLERVLTQSVQDVHLSDAARRNIRLATKEERPVKMKKFVAIALAVVLMLSASIAVAEELGLFDFLARKMGQTMLPGANELVQSDVAYGETDDVTFTVKQAVYDGKSASLLVEMRAKDEKTFLVPDGWTLDDRYGALAYDTEAEMLDDPRTIAEYAAENHYSRFLNVSVEFPHHLGDVAGIDEWRNNVLTVIYSLNAEGDELVLPLEYFTCNMAYTDSQRVPDQITLAACDPLWTVSSDETFDVPNFGIRIDGVTIIGTPLQSYFYIDYTVTSYQQHNSFGWNADLVNMDKEYLPRGVLGTGGTNHKGGTGMGMARWGGQHMTWYDTFGAMEQPPTELMILLRNWDDFDLNEYFPITLK